MKGDMRTTIIIIVMALAILVMILWFVLSAQGSGGVLGTEYELRTECLKWWKGTNGLCLSHPDESQVSEDVMIKLHGPNFDAGLCYKIYPTLPGTNNWGCDPSTCDDDSWKKCLNLCQNACVRIKEG